ncbi:aminopeptidase N [Symbioplanes lichenis]|uniref:aminopeptidase N n=1 Tax=Symbioplanes lichenis TaxID=1629072 RepID=UPI00273A3D37|nr:aminopeptidase N [Actinoplanes lichenis]
MSLTLDEARARAAMLDDVSYELALDVTSAEFFRSRVTVRFRTTGGDTFLELHRASELVVTVDGACAPAAYDGKRISLDGLAPGRHEVVVDARLSYVTDGEGMHTFTDPVDGERYVGAYLGLDITQRLFACFDQMDLKASVTVTVTADPAWTVLSNSGPARIPCNQFVVVAGPYHSIRWEHRGVPMGWHARRSLAAELERDAAELRRVTEECFDHYARIFTEPYAFGRYDQVFVPELNWGAMENPGCVTVNEAKLPRGRITDDERRERAMVIAHEMAHMWFGDLVTPLWWEDMWLNESFADYMGYETHGDRVAFEAQRKPGAYRADRRRSTHPVAPFTEDVPDVGTATTIFDEISYGKGNAVLRQLVTWLGEPDFLAGVNAHLTRHRFANATLEDLVSALDAASPRDVRTWARVWLRQSGHDTITVSREGDVPVLTRSGIRPHRFTVAAYTPSLQPVATRLVDLEDEPVALPEFAGLVVVPNAGGETFARLDLDAYSRDVLEAGLTEVADPLVRAVLWAELLDLDLLARHLPHEPSSTLVTAALDRAFRHVTPAALDRIAAACANASDVPRARGLARSTTDTALLRRWLDTGATDHGLPLDPQLRWSVVHRLATLGALDAAAIEAERLRDGTTAGDLGAATALAARPHPDAKAGAWAAMTDPTVSVRRFRALATGLWSQRDLATPYIAAYVAAAPELARRGSAFGQAVGRAFPAVELTADELDLVRDQLRTGVPTVLRRLWEDELDDRTVTSARL